MGREAITLAGNPALALQNGDLAGLSRLEVLYLDGNLSSVAVDAPDGLSASTELFVYNDNSLTSLPGDVFDGLSILQELQ